MSDDKFKDIKKEIDFTLNDARNLLRHWKFNDDLSLDQMQKIDNVLNAITQLYTYLT